MYRSLTDEEIITLEENGCWAEDWSRVQVAEDGFRAKYFHRVMFYGDILLGSTERTIEVAPGFFRHTGINDATLCNVSVGNECLIEKVGNYISSYTIGDNCLIMNISVMETTEGATYGDGNLVSVLNEAGDGNIILFHDLNSQLAAFMVRHFSDRDLKNAVRRLVSEEIARTTPDRGTIGNNVKIVNTNEIVNTVVQDDCEISGASRLNDCTIVSSENAGVFIGTGVICENSIIGNGSSIVDHVKIQDCYVGEACQIANGFSASQSVFFANTVMVNGEACAAFCGPFCASHHKSTLLIGGMFSFYNAGSGTNFSNHAYKMGPLHWGVLGRGSKTASGSYLFLPATVGAFSICFGKLTGHPDTSGLPFSYVIGEGDETLLVPGRNLTTVGLYRDISKWRKRDLRPLTSRKSLINFDWLSPYTVDEILRGKETLESLRQACGDDAPAYRYHGCTIKSSSLHKGIRFYDLALRLFMGQTLRSVRQWGLVGQPVDETRVGEWSDLAGQFMPKAEEQRLVDDIKDGTLETIQDVLGRFQDVYDNYEVYLWAWAYRMMLDYYGIDKLTEADYQRIEADYADAHRQWLDEIRKDAEKEYSLGDVDRQVIDDLLEKLGQETSQLLSPTGNV